MHHKKKCEILTKEEQSEIAGIPCRQIVKYLGSEISIRTAETKRCAEKTIRRNKQKLSWVFTISSVGMKELLLVTYATSLLVYVGTPLVAAGAWKKADVERLEKSLYWQAFGLPVDVPGVIVLYMAQNAGPAWDNIYRLARAAKLQADNQRSLDGANKKKDER